ncbi:hypothetical protein Droror1_Dr00012862 [Drosera rotundifolia]
MEVLGRGMDWEKGFGLMEGIGPAHEQPKISPKQPSDEGGLRLHRWSCSQQEQRRLTKLAGDRSQSEVGSRRGLSHVVGERGRLFSGDLETRHRGLSHVVVVWNLHFCGGVAWDSSDDAQIFNGDCNSGGDCQRRGDLRRRSTEKPAVVAADLGNLSRPTLLSQASIY